MRYLFEMGKTWHIYADMGNEWVYYRLERTAEEVIDKNGEALPGPLGRMELFQELEKQADEGKKQIVQQKEAFQKSYEELQKLAEELQAEGKMWRQRYLDLAYQVSPKGVSV